MKAASTSASIEEALEAFFTAHPEIRTERALVAVSGGGDSMGLLHGLLAAVPQASERLCVVHVDHGLRPDAAEDARFVAEAAHALDLPCEVVTVQVRGAGGVQAAARRARRAALEHVAGRHRVRWIYLAHTLDDQAETVLLRLLRGAGPGGLRGMAEVDPPWLRPLLGVARATIRRWLAARGIAHREDPSNRDPRYERTRIRHEVLPRLEALQPRVREALARHAALVREEDALLEGLAARLAKKAAGPHGLLTATLRAAPRPLARRVLVAAWRAAHRGPVDPVEERHVDRLLEALESEGSARSFTLPGGVMASLSMGVLAFAFQAFPSVPVQRVGGPGTYALGAERVLRVVPWGGAEGGWEEGRPVGRVPASPLVLRGPKPGDRCWDGRRLAAILEQARIPVHARPAVPVLVDGAGRVVWAEGLVGMTEPALDGRPGGTWAVGVEPVPGGDSQARR
ncbi:MAG: tRNA lysidine(34) synthetase TilS [Deltaproteobacteria bacterium]|nr:MAG: tRNA lysidine(34) synthetase TilS [Deltaproteobacteria bacterium]